MRTPTYAVPRKRDPDPCHDLLPCNTYTRIMQFMIHYVAIGYSARCESWRHAAGKNQLAAHTKLMMMKILKKQVISRKERDKQSNALQINETCIT